MGEIVNENSKIQAVLSSLLDKKISTLELALESTFDKKLSALESTFDKKLSALESTFDKKLSDLGEKIKIEEEVRKNSDNKIMGLILNLLEKTEKNEKRLSVLEKQSRFFEGKSEHH